jgi:hypothetical protein
MLLCLSLHRIVGWCHAGSIRPEPRRRTEHPWLREMRVVHENGDAAYSLNYGHHSKQRQQHTSTGLHSLATTTMLRGGNSLLASTPTAITAQLSSLYLLVQGAAMVLAPHKVMLNVYGIETETDEEELKADISSSGTRTPKASVSVGKFNLYLVRAMGALSIGMAINLFLAMVINIPVHQSIGYGLLPRLLFIITSFLFQTFRKVGMNKKYLQVNSVGMAWTCMSLLTGMGKPVEAAKTFSSVAFAKAVFLLFRPVEATKQYFGVDVSGEGKFTTLSLSRNNREILPAATGNSFFSLAFTLCLSLNICRQE